MGADVKRKEARKRRFGHVQMIAEDDLKQGSDLFTDKERTKRQKTSQRILTLLNHTSSTDEEPKVSSSTSEASAIKSKMKSKDNVKMSRFICFVGNLPFTATSKSIREHFAKVQPTSVRHGTVKDTGKSKGFAFLEFNGFDHMKTCLQVYHHSSFDDGVSPARKLNVELTVGGGGAKSGKRKLKLKAKNEKLNEERRRRQEQADTEARESEKKVAQELVYDPDIHPSRRSRVGS